MRMITQMPSQVPSLNLLPKQHKGLNSTPSSTYSASPQSSTLNTPVYGFNLNTPVNGYKVPAPHVDETLGTSESVKLADVLGVLDHEDDTCIFIVRRISKLGFHAHDALVARFSNFGPVKKVILLPSRGKGDSRNRPASMGFIVMQNCSDCLQIMQSDRYMVNQVDIQVQKFVRNAKIQVSDGNTVTNAYISSAYINQSTSNNGSGPFLCSESFNPIITLDQLEVIAESMLKNLGI